MWLRLNKWRRAWACARITSSSESQVAEFKQLSVHRWQEACRGSWEMGEHLRLRGMEITTRALMLTAVASILVDVIANKTWGFVPIWLTTAKGAVLVTAVVYYVKIGNGGLARYSAVLTPIVALAQANMLIGRMAA